MVLPSVVPHECNRILPCPSLPLMNYALRNYRAGDDHFKQRFQLVLEKDTVETVLAAFVHAALLGIRY